MQYVYQTVNFSVQVFFVTFSTYLLFLLSYSLYLANIFYRQGSTRRRIKLSELILITGQEENSNGRWRVRKVGLEKHQ